MMASEIGRSKARGDLLGFGCRRRYVPLRFIHLSPCRSIHEHAFSNNVLRSIHSHPKLEKIRSINPASHKQMALYQQLSFRCMDGTGTAGVEPVSSLFWRFFFSDYLIP
jgi:hypothetical protein